MAKKITPLYNKESLGDAIKYYLDNTGWFLTNGTMENDFEEPKPITKVIAEAIAEHVVMDMQKALIEGKQVYFPEIGIIKVVTKKAGTRMHNLASRSVVEMANDSKRIKVRTSVELAQKLNQLPPDEKAEA